MGDLQIIIVSLFLNVIISCFCATAMIDFWKDHD